VGTHCSQNKGLSLLAGERFKSAWQLDGVYAELTAMTVGYSFGAVFGAAVIGGASLTARSTGTAPYCGCGGNCTRNCPEYCHNTPQKRRP